MVQKNTYKLYTFLAVVLTVLILIACFAFSLSHTPKAQAAASTYLNFQARIKNSSGGLIADGYYNLEFKVYDASSGGTLLWTETRTSANKVRVVNGYMSVSLGSVTAFPGTIDWSQEHWITMNIGGTGSPSWDGEMSPRLQLTAVPHAFQADKASALTDGANSYTANDFIKVSPGSTQSINSSNASININQTGSGGLINLQSSGADVFTLTNSGQATFKNTTNSVTAFQIQNTSGTALLTADTSNDRIYIGNTSADATGTTLVLDTKNTAGDPTGTNGAMYYNSNTSKFRCYESGGWKDCITGAPTNAILNGGNSFGSTMTIGTNDSQSLSLETNNQTQLTIASGGATTFKNSVDSDNAFRIQNAAGQDVLNVSSLDSTVTITGSDYSVPWTGTSGYAGNWTEVAYGNGIFVAVSPSSPWVMTSPNGITWTSRTPAFNQQFQSVAYGNGVFVAVANTGPATSRVMTSPDGITWTARSVAGLSQNITYTAITFGDGYFVAVGDASSGGNTTRAMYSTDGINWTLGTTPNQDMRYSAVTYGDGLFIAVALVNYSSTNRVAYSSDHGATWSMASDASGAVLRAVTYGDGTYVAVGNSVVYTSTNGSTWTSRTPAQANQWEAVTYGDGMFYAVGASGTQRAMTSTDGTTWTSKSTADDTSAGWNGIVWGNNTFVAVSYTGTRAMFRLGGYYPNALNVSGNVALNGNVSYTVGGTDTATAVCRNSQGQLAGCTSASRFKENVANLTLGLDQLRLLQPVSYTWKSTGQDDIGFIAEQVAAVIPQAVTYNENGEVATFNYNTVSALLVSGVKDLDIKVSAIDTRLAVVEQGTFSGNITVAGDLTVSGLTQLATLRVNGKIISGGTTPTATLTDNTGTVNITGNDTAGTISFTAGTNPASGSQATITFNTPYDVAPRVVLTAGNDKSAEVTTFVSRTNSGFTVNFVEIPQSGSIYKIDYQILQ
jgi:hypothetical protein